MEDTYDKYPWERYKELKAEAETQKKNLRKAHEVIRDGLARYKKKLLNARSKKLAENTAELFAPLEEYRHTGDIQEAYGWDIISEAEYDRLMGLWELREKYMTENGEISDPVIELVEKAMRMIADEGHELIELVGEMDDILEAQKKERYAADVEWERKKYLESLK